LITLRTPAAAARFPLRSPRLPEPGITWVDPQGEPFNDAPSLRFVANVDPAAGEALFQGARRSFAEVMAEAAREGTRPRGFALRETAGFQRESANTPMSSPNVIGILPGTDPALAGEYVLLMAHLDGLGVREGGEGDRIRNGAMDNTTGISTLLEVARQMSQPGNRPRRPVIFAAVTAEEKGLLGAQYLARNPVVENGRVVGVVNLDMPVLTYNFSDVIAFGAEHSTLGPIVSRAAARMNVSVTPDPLPEQGLFTRSDHYMFVREGVPAVFLMTGFAGEGGERFRSFLSTQYHSPQDDLSLPFDWNAGARFAELNYLIAREIADAAEAPRWYRDSFFGTTLAPNAAKAQRPAGSGSN
jgi:Zn-dependent M28 family amino/carboxypeptidase